MSEKGSKKKSRAKYQCPADLVELIDLINLVPLNIEMLPSTSITKDFQHPKNLPVDEIVLQRFKDLLATLPIDFQNYFNKLQNEMLAPALNGSGYVFRPMPLKQKYISNYDKAGPFDINNSTPAELEILCTNNFLIKYDEFYAMRENMKKFAEVRNYERRIEFVIKNRNFMRNSDVQLRSILTTYKGLNDLEITAPILKDKNGKDYLGGFAKLIGTFDSNRLRICEICKKLFWAKREESETCSAACFNNLRQRRYRNLSDAEKAARRFQRQSTKQSKDEQKNPKTK